MNKKKKGSDLQGITRLITEATIGVTDLVEAMHQRVVHPPLLPSTPIQHLITKIAGVAYSSVRWSTRFVGNSLDNALDQLSPALGTIAPSDEKEAIRSALNGVVGDYLEEKENPLAITMQFRCQAAPVPLTQEDIAKTYPAVTGKVVVLVHGSCMNDLQWTRAEHNHGEALSKDLGYTPISLYYNSGRHVSANGQAFSEQLEQLLLHWPVPVEELVILAHSMGGLVSRSALHYGEQEQKSWIRRLKKVIFLGTPHHGAPLEKAGNYLDVILETIPYTKPFARLGKIRSAGVTDMRFGNLITEDWEGSDRFELQADKRMHIPLPERIECYSIAASTGAASAPVSSQLLGDRLVNVSSALGKHKNPEKSLDFKTENTFIVYDSTHLDLLSKPEVYAQIKAWLA